MSILFFYIKHISTVEFKIEGTPKDRLKYILSLMDKNKIENNFIRKIYKYLSKLTKNQKNLFKNDSLYQSNNEIFSQNI
jgi:hypothetical protein